VTYARRRDMCPRRQQRGGDPLQIDLVDELSESGSAPSNGPPGEPSPSESVAPDTVRRSTFTPPGGARLVRRHNGQATISVGLSLPYPGQGVATFIALSGGHRGDAHIVTLSLELTKTQWQLLERDLTTPGANVSVDVNFVPSTGNLVRLGIAQSI